MKSHRNRRYTVLLPLITAVSTISVHADITYNTWIATSGDWSVDSNWSLSTAGLRTTGPYHTTTTGDSRTLNGSSTIAGTLTGITFSLGTTYGTVDSLVLTGKLAYTSEWIGSGGAGILNQSGGTNTATSLYMASQTGSTGTYNLSAGILSSGNEFFFGYGSATFNQTGGTNTAGALQLSPQTGSTGTYNLAAGTLSSGLESVSGSGSAVFNQTGGTNSTPQLFLSNATGGSATYILSGGTLSAGSINVSGAASSFSWTAGTISVGTGTYSTFNASLLGTVDLTSSKSLAVHGLCTLWPTPGFVLDGGTLSVTSFGDSDGHAKFTWTSGTLSVADTTSLFWGLTANPVFEIGQGKTLNVPVDGVNYKGVIGLLPYQSILLDGGTINAVGYTAGASHFTWTSGSLNFTGSSGTLTLNSSSLGSMLTLRAGQSLSATSLNLPSASALTLSGGLLSAGSTTLSTGGQLTWQNGSFTASSLSLTGLGSTMQLSPRNGSNIKPLILDSLSISSGTLDLADNILVLNNTGAEFIQTLRAYLATGCNGGAWNGNGIDSSVAAADTLHSSGLGYRQTINQGFIFNGQAIPTHSLLVAYTFNGDDNLDGKVDSTDFSQFVGGFTGQGGGWTYGDFNYDNKIDINDFALFVAGYGANGQPLSVLRDWISNDQALSNSQKNAMLAIVPEPSVAGLIAMGSAMQLLRRRRRT